MKAYAIPSHARLIATLGFFLAVCMAFFVATTPAKAGVYAAHIKGAPGSITFSVFEVRPGKRVVADVSYRLPFDCGARTPHVFAGFFGVPPREKVLRGNAFHISVYQTSASLRFVGELKRGDHATGIYRERLDAFPGYGECKTGKLEWVAKRVEGGTQL